MLGSIETVLEMVLLEVLDDVADALAVGEALADTVAVRENFVNDGVTLNENEDETVLHSDSENDAENDLVSVLSFVSV